jgi:hypothetical protein
MRALGLYTGRGMFLPGVAHTPRGTRTCAQPQVHNGKPSISLQCKSICSCSFSLADCIFVTGKPPGVDKGREAAIINSVQMRLACSMHFKMRHG